MSPYESHANGIAEVENELAGDCPTFDWNGDSYRALPGDATRVKEHGIGGFSINASLRLTVLASAFSGSIDTIADEMRGTALTYRGEEHRITSVSVAPGGLQIEIECESSTEKT